MLVKQYMKVIKNGLTTGRATREQECRTFEEGFAIAAEWYEAILERIITSGETMISESNKTAETGLFTKKVSKITFEMETTNGTYVIEIVK